jgi:hypothetical protein
VPAWHLSDRGSTRQCPRYRRRYRHRPFTEPWYIAKPEPWYIAKPESRHIAEPEPWHIAEPESRHIAEPEPRDIAEPKPWYIAKPEPWHLAKPQSAAKLHPDRHRQHVDRRWRRSVQPKLAYYWCEYAGDVDQHRHQPGARARR